MCELSVNSNWLVLSVCAWWFDNTMWCWINLRFSSFLSASCLVRVQSEGHQEAEGGYRGLRGRRQSVSEEEEEEAKGNEKSFSTLFLSLYSLFRAPAACCWQPFIITVFHPLIFSLLRRKNNGTKRSSGTWSCWTTPSIEYFTCPMTVTT